MHGKKTSSDRRKKNSSGVETVKMATKVTAKGGVDPLVTFLEACELGDADGKGSPVLAGPFKRQQWWPPAEGEAPVDLKGSMSAAVGASPGAAKGEQSADWRRRDKLLEGCNSDDAGGSEGALKVQCVSLPFESV